MTVYNIEHLYSPRQHDRQDATKETATMVLNYCGTAYSTEQCSDNLPSREAVVLGVTNTHTHTNVSGVTTNSRLPAKAAKHGHRNLLPAIELHQSRSLIELTSQSLYVTALVVLFQ